MFQKQNINIKGYLMNLSNNNFLVVLKNKKSFIHQCSCYYKDRPVSTPYSHRLLVCDPQVCADLLYFIFYFTFVLPGSPTEIKISFYKGNLAKVAAVHNRMQHIKHDLQ